MPCTIFAPSVALPVIFPYCSNSDLVIIFLNPWLVVSYIQFDLTADQCWYLMIFLPWITLIVPLSDYPVVSLILLVYPDDELGRILLVEPYYLWEIQERCYFLEITTLFFVLLKVTLIYFSNLFQSSIVAIVASGLVQFFFPWCEYEGNNFVAVFCCCCSL